MKEINTFTNVVFAFSDTAGGNTCLAFAFLLQNKFNTTTNVYTNNRKFIENHWGIQINYVEAFSSEYLEGADLLFTGTSHPDTSKSFELNALKIAHSTSTYSISYVDHWTGFKIRFSINTHQIYPNEIWVCDAIAESKAIEEGLPKDKLKIHENPYLTYLSTSWKSKFYTKYYATQIDIPNDHKIILIAPDPVSIRKETRQFGFTESSALSELLEMINQLVLDKIFIILKIHPLQPLNSIESVVDKFPSLPIKIVSAGDNLEMINGADVILGFYSNFLLEALALQKPVIRYFPGDQHLDPLNHILPLKPISNMPEALLTLRDLLK